MANQLTEWPSDIFYIVSHSGDKHHALTDNSSGSAYALEFDSYTASLSQLWIAIKLPATGTTSSALIYNLATHKVLKYTNTSGTASSLGTNLASVGDNGQDWLMYTWENAPGLYSIRPAADTAKCVSIGSSQSGYPASLVNYSDSASTELAIYLEKGAIIPKSQGSFTNASNQTALNISGETITVDNRNMSTNYSGSVTLTYADEQSYAFVTTNTQTITRTVTASIGISGILAKILTIKADLSYSDTFTQTTTLESSQTHTTTKTRQYTCETNVPAGKAYRYAIQTTSIPFTADYTVEATLYPSYPNAAPLTLELPSKYVGRNTTSVTIVVTDVTSTIHEDYVEVSRITVPLR